MVKLTQPIKFIIIGGLSTLVHMSVGVTLIAIGIAPLIANIWAFCMAFLVSFTGHYSFSFKGHGKPVHQALPRFLAVALLGFGANELILYLLIKSAWMRPEIALFISTATVAVMTFFLSRAWAFAQTK